MLLCIPDPPKILLLDMDFLFFPVLYSNSMPKTLYTKPTTNLSQVSQIVNDLKTGREAGGRVALWIHSSTVGRFRNVKISQ